MPKRFKIRKITLKTASSKPDWLLAGLVLGLTIFGVVMVGNVSVVEALQDFGDQYHFFRLQLQWLAIGLGFMGLFFFLDYHRLRALAVPLLVFTLLSLVVVLFPQASQVRMGARRWLGVGGLNFQPAELAKLSFVLYLASLLSKKKKIIWPFLVLLSIIIFLIILEPDMGTAVIVGATAVIVYFISGAPLWVIFALGGAGAVGGLGLILGSGYRRERLLTFLHPMRDPLGASYHLRQILIALGSGGWTGLGLGQSRQKHEFLPAVTTDSIFAVIGEELGFAGTSAVVLAFLIFIWRGIKVAKEAPDEFGRLLAVGITAWIGLQALVNMAAMVALVPLTGIPLTLISYGGSSLVLALSGIGILLNISRQKVVKK